MDTPLMDIFGNSYDVIASIFGQKAAVS
jgi:hypothetical protein